MNEPAYADNAIPWQYEEWDGNQWKALFPSKQAMKEPNGNKNTTEKEFLDRLVTDHWNYIEGVLDASMAPHREIKLIEFHYKTAAVHFYKHALEYHGFPTLEGAP